MPIASNFKSSSNFVQDHGLLGSLNLEVAEEVQASSRFGGCAEILSNRISFNDQSMAGSVWNHELRQLNRIFALLRGDLEQPYDLATLSAQVSHDMLPLLELAPTQATESTHQPIGSFDPALELVVINFCPVFDDGIYNFLISHNITTLLDIHESVLAKLQAGIARLTILAKQQAPNMLTAWLAQKRKDVYETRFKCITERQTQFQYFPQLIDLYILSAVGYWDFASDKHNYRQCAQIASKLVKQMNTQLAREVLQSNETAIMTKLISKVMERLPNKGSRHLQVICLYNQFNCFNNTISFVQILDAFWEKGKCDSIDRTLYLREQSTFLKKYQTVSQPVISVDECIKFINLVRAQFSVSIVNKLLAPENQAAVFKNFSEQCIWQIYQQQLSKTFEKPIVVDCPLSFYVANCLPEIAVPKYQEKYCEENIAVASYLITQAYYTQHNPSILFMSMFAVMLNRELICDMSGGIDQTEKIAETRKLINSYLAALACFYLTAREKAVVKLVHNLLNGTLTVTALGTPDINNGFVVGYQKIENTLAEGLSTATLKILSNQFRELITPRRIVQGLFQKVLREEIKHSCEAYPSNISICNVDALIVQLKLAYAYLYDNDPFILAFESAIKDCVNVISRVLSNNDLQPQVCHQLEKNYMLLSLYPERAAEVETLLDSFLKNFNGQDVSLHQLFLTLDIPTSRKFSLNTSVSGRYYVKIINFYFNGLDGVEPGIKSKNEADYSSALALVFNKHSALSNNLKTEFKQQLLQFHQTHKVWLQAVLNVSEWFLTDCYLKQTIRSELFLRLLEDNNNAREMGQYSQVIRRYHEKTEFSELISPMVCESFEQKFNQQCDLLKHADLNHLVVMLDNEKWLNLLKIFFNKHIETYTVTVLKVLVKIAETTVDPVFFKLLVGSFVKQLPRTRANVDKVRDVRATEKVLTPFLWDDKKWNLNAALLIKHFGTVQLEEKYYLQAMSTLIQLRDKEACHAWRRQFENIYSAQMIEDFEAKSSKQLSDLFIKYTASTSGVQLDITTGYALAEVMNNGQVKQRINQQKLTMIMQPETNETQMANVLKTISATNGDAFDLKYESHNLPQLRQRLNELFGSVDFFTTAAAHYVSHVNFFDSRSIAIKLLREADLQKLLPTSQQEILEADKIASDYRAKLKSAIIKLETDKTFTIINQLKSFIKNKCEILSQRPLIRTFQQSLGDLLLLGISMLIQRCLLNASQIMLPARVIESYSKASLLTHFLAKSEKNFLYSSTHLKWAQAQAYTKLKEIDNKTNLSNTAACNKAIRVCMQLTRWGASNIPLTQNECHMYIFTLAYNKTKSFDGALDFTPSLEAAKVIYGVTGQTLGEVSHQYIQQHLQQSFDEYYQTELKSYDIFYQKEIDGYLADSNCQLQLVNFMKQRVGNFFEDLTKFLSLINKEDPDYRTQFALLTQLQHLYEVTTNGLKIADSMELEGFIEDIIASGVASDVVSFTDFLPMVRDIDATFPGLLVKLTKLQRPPAATTFIQDKRQPVKLCTESLNLHSSRLASI